MNSESAPPIARVLIDSALPQLDHLFDYAIPEQLAHEVRIGQRVRVPFGAGRRLVHGYLIEFAADSEFASRLQPIEKIVSQVPQLTPQVWQLARALADRAGGNASDILRLAIPPRMVRAETRHFAAAQSSTMPEPPSQPQPDAGASGTEAAITELAEKLCTGSRIAYTAKHGPERLHTGEWVGGWAVALARLALAVYRHGRSVIVVAPDYRDVDQLYDALVSLGHEGVVRVDSRQSGSARYASFLRALDQIPRIVLGNRSAVYAPAYRLGTVMVWDDGDPLLAEPRAPYVHARDAALLRASLENCGLFFGCHARSAEVQRLVDIGYVHSEHGSARRARVIAADAVQHAHADLLRVPEFVARNIREGLAQGPVLVQVATPGYAPSAVCGACAERARCGSCGGPVGVSASQRIVCRWCGEHGGAVSLWRCPECSEGTLTYRGAGSVRTAWQFERQFPGTHVIVSDGTHPQQRVDSRAALVVATRGAEPIAAGGYRVVVLLDVERVLGIESLRVGEDCLRWWQNAAALAAVDGRCLVASGGGSVVQAFVTNRIDAWLQQELRDRQQLRYPPAVRAASVTGGRAEVARALRALDGLPGVDVLGPTLVPPTAKAEPDRIVQGAGDDLPLSRDGSADDGGGRSVSGSLVRAIVRFDYAQGAEVAKRLRAVLVADAAGSAARTNGRIPQRRKATALRLRFDDRGVFDS